MKNKLTFGEYFIVVVILLMVFSICGKILMSYPFVLINKDHLMFSEKEGWVRYVKTTGKYSSQTLWFSEGEKSKQIMLVCASENSNYVSSSDCKLSQELLKEMPKEKNYTTWTKATVKIANLDIPILNYVYKHAFLLVK